MCGYICNNCGRCRGEGTWGAVNDGVHCMICGAEAKDGNSVCPACGAPLPVAPGPGKKVKTRA